MVRGSTYGIPLVITANTSGANKANKSLKSLIKNTKAFGLTSKLSIGAASVALSLYAKKSVAAALADEKAQKALAQTLKNLGLAYQTVGVSAFIDKLQRATGVSEDELRPAFQKLVLVLGDVGKAQSALGLAMDISAGTGKDLSAVSMALAKGYSGQTTALSRLGAGLSKTLLKSGDMEAITAQLSKLFEGQALVAAKTYSGQMAILGVSAKEASETIGTSLIDALIRLGDNKGIDSAAKSMENFAAQIGFAITGFAVMADKIAANPLFKLFNLLILYPLKSPFILASNMGKSEVAKGITGTNRQSPRGTEQAAAKAAAAARTKALADARALLALSKQTAANKKLSSMFDIDAIQIAAALKGKISDLDRKSLEAMQALKTEDKNDDIKALENLEQAKIAADAADRARKIKALQDTINFNKAALDDWQANFDKMNSNATKMLGLSAAAYSVGAPSSTQQTGLQQAQTDLFKGTLPDLSYLTFDLAALGAANAQMDAGIAAQQSANVTVNLQGGINIGSTLEFYQTVQAAVQEATRNGWSLAGTATG